ncbi:hypothetical protein UXJ26_06250 [Burkholderia multivorans]|uniref:Bacteriophage protein n=1 Tax=Burkholderia multivorans (strain ATCC 17616 / 249) TaxID=395019 RepID=A0A0H3KVV1_BURM1|nr:hypothetical protein [Burkholderia multivorans]YP_355401.1 tail fiber protein [Burkholderia phage Bcep176]ABA60067.1 gp66 [Burkholderia phage Bcep176]ABX17561.1 hypothetical protein Bmul_3878 [Burkholderia multivorans ATCC 17616]PRF62464.1 hypothetical protein C6Q28_10840 [Burkholderia multivorans]BAG46474.1 bacteriophage protein [Burkholderia multivorans ATCC 17616]
MSTLQKINLGTPPRGDDGDSTRVGFAKMNANVDVLSMLVALGYALITDNTTLTPDQVGTRYGINIADPGKSITIPLASSVPVNACLQFFNVGSAVTVATQGNDGTQIRALNKGDWATYISDGVKYWHVAERGKMLSDEIVGGNLTVGGRVLLGGASDDGSTALQVKGAASIGKFLSRPTFADNVPWDSGNFDPASKLSVVGRKDGIAPAAGNVGEILTSTNSTIVLPSNRTAEGTTTLLLTAGEWDVQGNMIFNYNANGVTLTMAFVSVATSSASIVGGQFAGIDGLQTMGWVTFVTPMVRFRFAAPTTVWLNAQAAANVNVPCWGQLTARRVAA